MKKLSKIVLGSILSVAMVVTGGLAALNYKPYSVNAANDDAYATAKDFINGMTTWDTPDAATGSPSISYVVNEKQAGSETAFTGIKLTGGNNDVFKFGNINLTKLGSYWGGDDHYSVDQDSPANYESETSIDYKPLLSFVYAPTYAIKNSDTNGGNYTPEMDNLYIRLVNTVNSNEYVVIRIGGRKDDTSQFGVVGMWAATQLDGGDYKSPKNFYGERNRDGGICLNEIASKRISNRGWATSATDIIYDANKNAVYSSATMDAVGLYGSYCVRNFANDKSKYSTTHCEVNSQDGQTSWSGFTKNADGEVVVEMDIKFNVNATCSGESYDAYIDPNDTIQGTKSPTTTISTTSIILTGFGGYDFTTGTNAEDGGEDCKIASDSGADNSTQYVTLENSKKLLSTNATLSAPYYYYQPLVGNKPIIGSTAKIYQGVSDANATEITFTDATVTHKFARGGNYTIDYYIGDDKIGTETLTVYNPDVSGSTFGTYTQPNLTTANYTGLKLTGGTGATFDLGTIDISKSKWANSDLDTGYTSMTAGGDYSSFLEFVFQPTDKDNFSHGKNSSLGGELSEVTFKISQGDKYFEFKVCFYQYAGDDTYEMVIITKADNQNLWGAFRDNAYLVANTYNNYPTVRKSHVKPADSEILGYGNANKGMNTRGATAMPISFYFSDNALYTPMTFGNDTSGLGVSYLIRDFDSNNVKYNNDVVTNNNGTALGSSTAAACTVWDGFTSDSTGATNVNVSVTFGSVNNVDESSIVITKLGDIQFANGLNLTDSDYVNKVSSNMPTAAVGGETLEIPAPVKYNKFDMNWLVNSYATVTYADADDIVTNLDNITFVGETLDYTFDKTGKYTFTFYTEGGEKIGESVVNSYATYNVTLNLVNATCTDNLTGLNVGDTITITPNQHEFAGDLLLTDVRKFSINGVEYNYDTVNKLSTSKLVYNEDAKTFTYTVSADDDINGTISIAATFDRYCKITIADSESKNGIRSEGYYWTMTDSFSFPVDVGSINNNKYFIGYARTDVGAVYGSASNEVKTRSDVNFKFDETRIYYKTTALGLNTSAGKGKNAYMIVPDMTFEMIYFDYNIRYEIQTRYENGTINEDKSGLRFVVEFEKESFDKYLFYTGSLSGITVRNYITTVGQIEAGGKKTDISKITVGDWLNDGWNSSTTANNLGLKCIAEGTTIGESSAPSYLYIQRNTNSNDVWLSDKYNVNSSTHYAMAITISNIKSTSVEKDLEFVYMPLLSIDYVNGGATRALSTAKSTTISAAATTLYDSHVSETKKDGFIYTFKDSNEMLYYSDLSLTEVNWLASKTNGTKVQLLVNDTNA